jgi:hypothetical protein
MKEEGDDGVLIWFFLEMHGRKAFPVFLFGSLSVSFCVFFHLFGPIFEFASSISVSIPVFPAFNEGRLHG